MLLVDLSKLDAIITKPPSDMVSPLYSNATFTCEGVGTVINWSINGRSVSYYPRLLVKENTELGPDGITSSTLTVASIPLNSKTSLTISCFMALTSSNTEQKGASLNIQGLDPLENLSVDQSSSSSYTVSLQPPSSVLSQFYDDLVYSLTIAGKSYTTSNTSLELSDIISCDVNVAVRVNSSLGFISNDSYLSFNFSSCGNSDSSGYCPILTVRCHHY
jgi:hypothetical protein